MRNQKGEAILFCILLLVALSGLLTLCGLKMQKSFQLMQKRTHLFLCVKETKGEVHQYLKNMGRLNWVLKNISKAQLVAVFIPYLWPFVGNAEKLKKAVKVYQAALLIPYGIKMKQLASRCPIDPRLYLNPFTLGSSYGFSRSADGAAKLRSKKWTYYFLLKPYVLNLNIDASKLEALHPKIEYQAQEKLGTLSSLLPSH